jgi:hypothetical protein
VRASAGVRRQRGLAVRRARGGPKAPVVRGTAGDAAQEFRTLGTSKRASSGLRVPATSTTSRKFLPPPPGRALLDTDRSNRSPHGSEPNMLITH